ncbi:MAG: ChbG/HpnK family deacetylase [Thermoguttaceae bacterium]
MRPLRVSLHADDLGLNQSVDDGVVRGFRDGLLTSASVLANAPDAPHALGAWKSLLADQSAGSLPSSERRVRLDDPRRPFDLGVHGNLTQGRPLTRDFPSELLDAEGRFLGVFSLFVRLQRGGRQFSAAIRAELKRQIEWVADHGVQPTHFNGHQYVELFPTVAPIVLDLLAEFRIRSVRVARERSAWRTLLLRGNAVGWFLTRIQQSFARRFQKSVASANLVHAEAFFGASAAGRIDPPRLRQFLAAAGNAPLVEIALHPGGRPPLQTDAASESDDWRDPLARLRPVDLQTVTSPDLVDDLEFAGRRLGRLAPD